MSLITSFKTLFEKKPVVQDGELFRHLQEVYPTLNEAAGDLLQILSDKDFKGDLTLAAQMAGLKMLRSSGVDLGRHTPGHILLGAIPDEAYIQM